MSYHFPATKIIISVLTASLLYDVLTTRLPEQLPHIPHIEYSIPWHGPSIPPLSGYNLNQPCSGITLTHGYQE